MLLYSTPLLICSLNAGAGRKTGQITGILSGYGYSSILPLIPPLYISENKPEHCHKALNQSLTEK
jgi:hypothetical protein